MIKVLYLGKNYLDVIDLLPKSKKFVILDKEEFNKTDKKGFIKYVDDVSDILELNENDLRILVKKGLKYDESVLRKNLVVKSFEEKDITFNSIGLHGDKHMIIEFIDFLSSYYRCGISVIIGGWQEKYFKEESLLKNLSKFNFQISLDDDSLIRVVLDNSDSDIDLYLWNGNIEELYKWKNNTRDNYSLLLTKKYFKKSLVTKKWNIKNMYYNKYILKKVWESICLNNNML